MARWSLWRRWFAGTDYEQELPRLADQIRAAQLAADRSRASQRKTPALFLVSCVLLYGAYALFVLLNGERKRRLKHQAAILFVPVLIGFVFSLLGRLCGAVVRRRDRVLKSLVARRKALVEEYKKKTNYDKIHKLIADPEEEAQKAQRASKGNKKESATARSAQSRSGQQGNQVPQGPLKNTGVPGSPGVPGGSAGSVAAVHNPGAVAGSALSPTAAAAAAAAANRRTWVDRLVDLVLGENELSPANRDALICPVCYRHNGLAPFNKSASEITYRCPGCGYLNVSEQDAKAAEEAKSDTSPKEGETASSESLVDVSPPVAEARENPTEAETLAETEAKKEPSAESEIPVGARARSFSPFPEPASPASDSKSVSKHLDSSSAEDGISVEERIMKEIKTIQKEVEESRAHLENSAASTTSSSTTSSRSTRARRQPSSSRTPSSRNSPSP